MANEGVTGSAVNELEVSEREFEHRNRAKENLCRMKAIEKSWQRVSVKPGSGKSIICNYKPRK